jgi:RsiW-degrading membrane proteinase PrsW (M82 family)
MKVSAVEQRLRLLKVLTLVCGLILLGGGVGCMLLYLLLPVIYGGPDLLATSLTVASMAAMALVLGFALAYQARASLRGLPSRTFERPSPQVLVLVFLVSLLVGQSVISLAGHSAAAAIFFPPFHILAAASPALAILAFVGRRTKAGSWRTVSLEVSHGALLATLGALAAELMVILALAIVVSMVVVFTPGGPERLMELSTNLQDPLWLENPENLAQLLLSPAGLLLIFLLFVLTAPLIEEFLKGLGVLLLGYRLRGRAQALLWGVACGAGFALAEGLFNGSLALEGWALIMLLRFAASLMHCAASGIMGLGWHETLTSRRPWRLLATYAAATGIHALWNAASMGVALPSLLIMDSPDDVFGQSLAGLAILGSVTLLVVLTVSMVVVLWHLTKRIPPTPPGPAVPGQPGASTAEIANSTSAGHTDGEATSEEGS